MKQYPLDQFNKLVDYLEIYLNYRYAPQVVEDICSRHNTSYFLETHHEQIVHQCNYSEINNHLIWKDGKRLLPLDTDFTRGQFFGNTIQAAMKLALTEIRDRKL